jgi:hypothetical protein
MRSSSPAWTLATTLSSGLMRSCPVESQREHTRALIPWPVVRDLLQGTVELTVWDFALPLQPSLKSLFGGGDGNLSAGGALAAGIEAELLRNRSMPDTAGTALASESTDISRHGLNDFDLGYYENVSYGNCTGEYLKPDHSLPPDLAGRSERTTDRPLLDRLHC